jgi:oligoribonuclease
MVSDASRPSQEQIMSQAFEAHPPPTAAIRPNEMNLVWVDMEMTGLDPDNDRVIEIAAIVTDAELNILAEGPVFAIHQSDEVIDKVKASTVTEDEASAQMISFLRQYVPAGKSPMCGNSICQDRRFMARHMSQLEQFFHYRNVDVSTIKELCRRWKPELINGFKKHQMHTALADIRESVEELRYYREHFIKL